jgi:hypothetical protein
MSERTIDAADVEAEHQSQVQPARQWAYLLGVLAGGTLLMLALIALLGTSG